MRSTVYTRQRQLKKLTWSDVFVVTLFLCRRTINCPCFALQQPLCTNTSLTRRHALFANGSTTVGNREPLPACCRSSGEESLGEALLTHSVWAMVIGMGTSSYAVTHQQHVHSMSVHLPLAFSTPFASSPASSFKILFLFYKLGVHMSTFCAAKSAGRFVN